MKTLKPELTKFGNLKELKSLFASQGPCLSAFMPLNATGPNQSAKANELAWREIIRTAEPRIQQYGAEGRELLDSISDWRAISQDIKPEGRSAAVFRSPDVFDLSWLEEQVRPKAVVGPHFYVRPLLPELTRNTSFYILALSQKNVRLLRCTTRTSETVELPAEVPTSFDAYMNTAKPDHVLDNRSTAGPDAGSSKGVMFGTSSDREDKDQYLAHFYRQIDRGVNEALRGKIEPLVLVGVEYEIALYRSVNHYPRLAKESVEGAPNSLKSGEMHARAIDAILRCYETRVDEALGEYNHKVGSGASNRLKDVVTAAHEGRVLTLLVSDLLETTGKFDESTYTVKGRETGTIEDEDLVNDAAVQTILHAGQVYVVPNSKMPNGAPLAAIYRF
jgi:hypothetical protein